MSARPEIIAETRRWIEKAEQDLLAAEELAGLSNPNLLDIACYHCQQSAEKFLKGLLVFNEASFPKTHDLRILLELAQRCTALEIIPEDLLPLNRYVIEARYPGAWEPIESTEATQAIRIAGNVRHAIRELIAGAAPQIFDA